MRPTNRFFLFLLIILLSFTTVPVVQAVSPSTTDFDNATAVTCADPPTSWDGVITLPAQVPPQVDYYALDLVAGQVLTIDVDAEKIGSSLDSILEVFDAAGNLVAVSAESSDVPAADPASSAPGMDISPDPYLEMTVDVDGTYYLAVSAETPGAGADTGSYTLLLKCSDPSIPPEPVEPVKVGDLLGSAGESLVTINPVDGASTLRFDSLGLGPIADIEYQYSTPTLFVATDGVPSSIIAIDPDAGTIGNSFTYDSVGFIALESAENTLYGVQVDSSGEQFTLVTIDQVTGDFSSPPVASFVQPVWALAYHSLEKKLYGAASSPSGIDLITIDLTSYQVDTVGPTGLGRIKALDFSHENVLYGVDGSGNLLKIDHTTGEVLESIPIDSSAGGMTLAMAAVPAGVSGLTFVIGEPQDVEPIKTICSSTLTSPTTANTEAADRKLSRFKLKNRLRRAIGLFKFQASAGENITIHLAPEVEESAEAGEESTFSTMEQLWPRWRRKGRVFLGVRDSIPGVDLRVRKKDSLPMDLEVMNLPADGSYYIMVIRPLFRLHKADYCLTLESDDPESQAWQTLDVAWPSDDSEEGTTSTSAETKTAEVQKDDVADDGSSASEPSTPTESTEVAPALTAVAPVSVAPASDAVEPVDQGSSQEVQADAATTVDDAGGVTPEESPAASLLNPEDDEGDVEELQPAEETAIDETGEVAPAEKPTVESSEEEPMLRGAPSIPEATTVDQTEEVKPEESADDAISEVVEKEEPPESSTP